MLITTQDMARRTGASVPALYKRAQRGDLLAVRAEDKLRWIWYETDGLAEGVGHVLRLAAAGRQFLAVSRDLRWLEVHPYADPTSE